MGLPNRIYCLTLVCQRSILSRYAKYHSSAPLAYPRMMKLTREIKEHQQGSAPLSPFAAAETMDQSRSTDLIDDISSIKNKDTNAVVKKCTDILANLAAEKATADGIEITHRTDFGSIRFDTDNKHVQHKNYMENDSLHEKEINLNDIDSQYFGKDVDTNYSSSTYSNENFSQTLELEKSIEEPTEYIDRQFFGSALDRDVKKEQGNQNILHGEVSNLHSKEDINAEKDLNYIDEIFFKDPDFVKNSTETTESETQFEKAQIQNMGDFEASLLETDEPSLLYKSDPQFQSSEHIKPLEEALVQSYKSHLEKHDKPIDDTKSTTQPLSNHRNLQEKQNGNNVQTSDITISGNNLYYNQGTKKDYSGKSDNALDYVIEKRRKDKLEKLMEKAEDGTEFIPAYKKIISRLYNLSNRSKHELQELLEHSIIYNDNGIVALSKPYGMKMHGGGGTDRDLTLQDMLPLLCRHVGADQLLHIHRLDATTTGVLLLAKDEATADKLRAMFKQRKVVKTYLAITKSVPSLEQGVIDIPLKESMVDDKRRMGLRPVMENVNQRQFSASKAVTKYKVLSSCYSAALLSVHPQTGVKHQIRAHLGLALNCPILADHKYSYGNRIVPQKLPGDMLSRLQMKQSRVRDLPLLLHSSSIFLPQFADGVNVKISCPPPPHFTKAMKLLKLNSRHNLTNIKNIETVDIGAAVV